MNSRASRLLSCAVAVLAAVAMSACASGPRLNPAPVDPSPAERLAKADALVREGCYDCLVEALQGFTALRPAPAVAEAATLGAVRTAVLLAIRERELGTEDSGYLTTARGLLPFLETAPQELLQLRISIADTLPERGGARQVADDVGLIRDQTAIRNRDTWTAALAATADQDPLSAYLWLSFNCAYTPTAQRASAEWANAIPTWRTTALLTFRLATCGGQIDSPALQELLAGDPRFVETHYFIALAAAFTGRIDEAMQHLTAAYEWRPRWPAVTNSLGADYMALEEFDRAIEFFDRTLAVVPDYPDALLNKIKAQTYAARYTEALETVDRLLALERWLVGDARYWKALNESQLGRLDEAWQNVELASKLIVNSQVPKLAGLIAYRRQQLDVARERFELAHTRDRNDCETGYYLGLVLAEQSTWARTADVLIDAVACFERDEAKLNQEIGNIRGASLPPDRRDRQIARREQQIAENRRRMATAWYNTAVSYFSLSRADEARIYADKVVDDEQFGDRARALLARLR